MKTLLDTLNHFGASFSYWLVVWLLGISQEGLALYYQHGLGYQPCLLCIQVRMWVLGLILIALLAQWVRRYRWLNLLAHWLVVGVAVGMFDRAWILLGTERGTLEGSCSMSLGMPAWFALDQWLPAMFEVRDFCGYTPNLLFGVTMAEGLCVFSVLMGVIALLFGVVGLIQILRR